MESPIRVLTVDDHALLRDGIAAVLSAHSDIRIAGEASTGAEAIERFRALRPDVTLMDLQMPGMDGVETIEQIRREFPDAKVIVLTIYDGDVRARRAIAAGASGYLLKGLLRRELVDAVRTVHAGGKRIPADIAISIAEHHADDVVSNREIEVLKLVAAGHANKIVADRLNISEETVKSHMRNIMSKLSASDRTHAVTIAMRRGIL